MRAGAALGFAFIAATMTATAAEFHVKDFGAVADAPEDAGPGIRAAIAAAVEAGPGSEVVLDAGVYRVGRGGTAGGIHIENADGITVRGQGDATEIILTDPTAGGFYISGSRRVTVRDVAIDHDPVPFTQGVITAVDREAGWFELDLQPGYPSLEEPWFAEAPSPYGRWGMIFDPVERRLKTGAPDFIFMDSWEPVRDRIWRLHPVEDQRDRLESMDPGDRFVYMARHGRGAMVFFAESAECTAQDVTIYASQSLATASVAGDLITLRRVRILHRPDADRLLTTNADGAHMQQNLRGPIIEECVFEGMADDSVNIYYPPNIVSEVVSPTELRTVRGGTIRPGDSIQIVEGAEGRRIGEARILEAEGHPGAYRLVLDRPIEGVQAGDSPLNAHTIYNMSRTGRGFIIRNNVFRNHRRHGIMAKAPDGLIEGNVIDSVGAYGMVVGDDKDWPEGSHVDNVVIRNNVIRNVGYGKWYGEAPTGAAIVVWSTRLGHQPGTERCASNITVSGNVILNPPGAGISILSARDVTLVDNTITYEADARLLREPAAVHLDNVEGVRLDALTVDAAHPDVKAAVSIGPNTPADGVDLGAISFSSPDDKPDVDDQRPNPTP